jgi:Cytochrome c554 and c-prime
MTRFALLLCLLMPLAAGSQTAATPPAACAKCHVEALTQPSTYMAHALESIDKCTVLTEHPSLTATIGKYTYHIERKDGKTTYSVTDGTDTVTMNIAWAMGASSALGQTYILEKDGQMFESRVSWFRELNGLALTMGYEGTTAANLTEAAGRQIHMDEKLRCFGCHSTHAVQGKQLTLDKLDPGVQCAHCHQGVDAHLAATLAGSHDLAPPPDLHQLIARSAEQTSNFCGQCHRTWAEIAMQPNPSIANIRFQPYRLTGSKCFDPDDPRISCLACHNPHHDFDHNTGPKMASFDPKCLSCHAGAKSVASKPITPKAGAKACPVAKSDCVSCHMPRIELPGAHYKFTDHRIRIVKPGEPYPG